MYYWIFTVLKKKFQDIARATVTMQGKSRKMGDELAVAKKAPGEVISTVLRVQVEGNCYSSVQTR